MEDINQFYKDKTVVITGAGGYIGGQLVSALQKTEARIIRVSSQDLPSLDGVNSFKLDIKTRYCWNEIADKADIVFHLAGNTSVYAAAKDPLGSLTSTLVPIVELISAVEESKRPIKVVYASTVTVYGLTNELPVNENAIVSPVSLYDLHKVFAEEQLLFASKKGILNGVCLRLANVYGPSINKALSNDRGVLNKVTKFALEGKDLQLFGGGDFIRDYVFIDDVVHAFLLAGLSMEMRDRSFNVATGKGTTVGKVFHMVVEQVEAITKHKVDIQSVPFPPGADPTELRNFVGDIGCIEAVCGWKPTINLEEGINQLISSFTNSQY